LLTRDGVKMKLKKIRFPNTYLILFFLLIAISLLTWVIPGGKFETELVDGREMVIPGSFQWSESQPQGLMELLRAPIKGFVQASEIIIFVLLVGGAFAVFQKTKAVDAVIRKLAKAHKKSSVVRVMLIPLFMTLFSLGGAVFGMAEETIPFVLVFVPLALALGYDSLVGAAIPFVGSGAGFAGAFFNPFTVGIAQGIAELPLFSGFEYRIIVWLVTTTVAILFVSLYAAKIRKNPEKSLMYEIDKNHRKELNLNGDVEETTSITGRQKLVLVAFAASMILLVFGVLKLHWYIEEIAALFLGMGIVVGILGGLNGEGITKGFEQGAKDLVGTAVIIGLARGVLIIANDGLIIGTMLHGLSTAINGLHPIVSAQAMFIFQSCLNFFVPSGSGQAALTMPIMAPLSDLVGVSRQTAVLAYQFGDGFSNLIIPTSAIVMGVITLARIPWEKWAKWVFPLMILLTLTGMVLLIPPFFFIW
jgi:uncharacterized ion transporter superfamily protein YfcC